MANGETVNNNSLKPIENIANDGFNWFEDRDGNIVAFDPKELAGRPKEVASSADAEKVSKLIGESKEELSSPKADNLTDMTFFQKFIGTMRDITARLAGTKLAQEAARIYHANIIGGNLEHAFLDLLKVRLSDAGYSLDDKPAIIEAMKYLTMPIDGTGYFFDPPSGVEISPDIQNKAVIFRDYLRRVFVHTTEADENGLYPQYIETGYIPRQVIRPGVPLVADGGIEGVEHFDDLATHEKHREGLLKSYDQDIMRIVQRYTKEAIRKSKSTRFTGVYPLAHALSESLRYDHGEYHDMRIKQPRLHNALLEELDQVTGQGFHGSTLDQMNRTAVLAAERLVNPEIGNALTKEIGVYELHDKVVRSYIDKIDRMGLKPGSQESLSAGERLNEMRADKFESLARIDELVKKTRLVEPFFKYVGMGPDSTIVSRLKTAKASVLLAFSPAIVVQQLLQHFMESVRVLGAGRAFSLDSHLKAMEMYKNYYKHGHEVAQGIVEGKGNTIKLGDLGYGLDYSSIVNKVNAPEFAGTAELKSDLDLMGDNSASALVKRGWNKVKEAAMFHGKIEPWVRGSVAVMAAESFKDSMERGTFKEDFSDVPSSVMDNIMQHWDAGRPKQALESFLVDYANPEMGIAYGLGGEAPASINNPVAALIYTFSNHPRAVTSYMLRGIDAAKNGDYRQAGRVMAYLGLGAGISLALSRATGDRLGEWEDLLGPQFLGPNIYLFDLAVKAMKAAKDTYKAGLQGDPEAASKAAQETWEAGIKTLGLLAPPVGIANRLLDRIKRLTKDNPEKVQDYLGAADAYRMSMQSHLPGNDEGNGGWK